MNISPKVEPWLRSLLDGVENSNHNAEVVATAAYAAPALVKALEECANRFRSCMIASGTDDEYADIAVEPYLALARGETP